MDVFEVSKIYFFCMLTASAVGIVVAQIIKLVVELFRKDNWRKKKPNLKAIFTNLVRPVSMPLGRVVFLTVNTLLALTATTGGSSVGAGYDLDSLKAVPFYVFVLIDVIVLISEIVEMSSKKEIRKPVIMGIIVGVVLGFVVGIVTLKTFINMGYPMPWYGG